jgi:choline dehydrogenase
MVEAARSIGMSTFDSNNGRMMEGGGGTSIIDVNVRDGKRLSVFRSYVFPYMDRPNLTVLTHALVTRLTLEGRRSFWSALRLVFTMTMISGISSLSAIQSKSRSLLTRVRVSIGVNNGRL